jgi:hypothetical protein
VRGEAQRDRASDAPAGAGYECYFSFKFQVEICMQRQNLESRPKESRAT